MNLYRIDRLGSLAPKIEIFAANEHVASEVAAWHLYGVSAIYVELAEAFVPHAGSTGWIARLRCPGVELDLSIVLVIRDAVVHT